MFSTIRQGSTLYILEKGQDLNLRVGQCTNIQNNYSTYLGNNTVDITVKCANDLLEFKQLPAALSTATYNNTIISDTRELISQEVENLIKSSKQIIDNIPMHKSIVEKGEIILTQLNPQFAQQKEQEQKISNLETKVGSMESKLDDIATMLTKVLQK